MYRLYDDIPFGVIILKENDLLIDYINVVFLNLLNIDKDIIGKSIYQINKLEKLIGIFRQCFDNKINKKLKQINLCGDKYFDFIIEYDDNKLKAYIYDVSDYIAKENIIKKDRERFLSVWSELKTKCDILEKLRHKEKECLDYLKNIIYNMSEGIYVLDNKGKFDFCNKAFLKILDFSLDKVETYKEFFEYIDYHNIEETDITLKKLTNNYSEIKEPINDFIIKIKQKRGIKYIEMNCSLIKNLDGKLLNIVIMLKDVTEVKMSGIKLKAQTKLIKDVVNTIDIPIAVIDYPNLNYQLLNKEYENVCRLFNFHKYDKFNGVSSIHIRTILEQLIKNINKSKEHVLCPYYTKDENGEDKYFKMKFNACVNCEGNVDKIFLYALDITDEVKRSKELETIAKMKDEFFSMISHELRTPLTIIYSSLQLANNVYRSEITPNIQKVIFRINQNSRRLLKLINNILDISKAEAGFLQLNYSSFDIVSVTENIVSSANLYAKSKGINLIFDTTEEEELVNLDKDKYERIILNLLSNAIKFTKKEKSILITTKIEKQYVEVSVKDEGVGIPKENLSHIFDRFVQVNNPLSKSSNGTGLGLSLVDKLVKLMNGSIEVKSELNKGTEFIIKFTKANLEQKSKEECFELDATINNKLFIEFSDFK